MRRSSAIGALCAVLLPLLVGTACRCGTSVRQQTPQMDHDSDRVDFGAVQLGVEHTRAFRIRNLGNASLTVSDWEVAAPFSVKESSPLTVAVGGEGTLTLAFTPTVVGKREQANLTFTSDDPSKPTVTLALAGTGVQAVATVSPSPIDFGDVYVGTTKSVKVTVTNTGSSELNIARAVLDQETPSAVITGELAPLSGRLAAGASVSAQVAFAPRNLSDLVKGNLVLELTQGGPVKTALRGQPVHAVPELCFQFDGQGTATCSGGDSSLNLVFPPTCDNRLFPPGNPSACSGEVGANIGVRKAKVWVRNSGNVPVRYSLQFVTSAIAGGNPCGLNPVPASDFTFSNAPSGTPITWTESTVQLPANPMDAKPWQTAPVEVTYRASSLCSEDAADQARIVLTRQGDSFEPSSVFLTLNGTSRLPLAVPSGWSASGTAPLVGDFFGVANAGSAPMRVTQVTLQERVPEADGGIRLVNCGQPVANDGGLACERFSWVENPNASAPITVPAATVQGAGTVKLGRLAFGADGGTFVKGQTYRLNARVTTDDPYHSVVDADVQGRPQ